MCDTISLHFGKFQRSLLQNEKAVSAIGYCLLNFRTASIVEHNIDGHMEKVKIIEQEIHDKLQNCMKWCCQRKNNKSVLKQLDERAVANGPVKRLMVSSKSPFLLKSPAK